ncbi:hypothetical protein CEF21_19865 [Bacillus sp. FJAT-42376]|uniref:hypothetical protein n=1 Tax=Bacillus sp. FJAT-42376 TaxID=2014076 RepID=UPI000F71893D|nr:hypothetical protein [Bacillus sp. FJAT-42376]AZB44365.1 hypothetical protein CEF21_19865 [Bacillus sp. FJAT-42376]
MQEKLAAGKLKNDGKEHIAVEINPQEALALIKKRGTELERSLNNTIQIQLNREELLNLAAFAAPFIKRAFEQSQEITEFLSVPLNFPTKRDFVSLANLSIQIEEKLDQIEGYLYQIASQNPAPVSLPSPPAPGLPAPLKQLQHSAERGRTQKELLRATLMKHAFGFEETAVKDSPNS